MPKRMLTVRVPKPVTSIVDSDFNDVLEQYDDATVFDVSSDGTKRTISIIRFLVDADEHEKLLKAKAAEEKKKRKAAEAAAREAEQAAAREEQARLAERAKQLRAVIDGKPNAKKAA